MQLYDKFKYLQKDYDRIFVIGDLHFSDLDNYAQDCNWPTPEEQIELINHTVGKKDVLIVLGDVGDVEYVKKLKGYKVLVMGNHDKGASNYIKKDIPVKITGDEFEVLKRDTTMAGATPWIKTNNSVFKKYKRITCSNGGTEFVGLVDNHLFDEVYEGPVFIGKKLVLSHEPLKINFGINIHAHVHDGVHKTVWLNDEKAMFNVSAPVIGYTPMRLDKLIDGIDTCSIHRVTINNAVKRNEVKDGQESKKA